jgi:hypothetical protein
MTTMKHRLVMFGLAAIVAGSVSACGGSGYSAGSTTPPPPNPNQGLDTAQVLAQSRETSETSDPYAVNSGVVYFTDTLDTTDAAVITGT